MLNKLQVLEDKYIDLTEKISDMEIINDQKVWQKYMKEHADLEPIVNKYREYKSVLNDLSESKAILEEESDEELRELAKMEISELECQVEPLEAELKILLLPKDPNDEKNVIVEIRGGDEAALFAGNLFRMYSRYAERRRWKMELLSASDTGVGGYKEVSFLIKGKGASVAAVFFIEFHQHAARLFPRLRRLAARHHRLECRSIFPIVRQQFPPVHLEQFRKYLF